MRWKLAAFSFIIMSYEFGLAAMSYKIIFYSPTDSLVITQPKCVYSHLSGLENDHH